MYLEINLLFSIPYCIIDLNFFICIKRDSPLTRKPSVLTEAFGDLYVMMLELQMFQSLQEKDEIYFPFVSRAKFPKILEFYNSLFQTNIN